MLDNRGDTRALVCPMKGVKPLLRMELNLWRVGDESKKGLSFLTCKVCSNINKAARQVITAFNPGGKRRHKTLDNSAQSGEQDNLDGKSTGDETVAGNTAGEKHRCCTRKICPSSWCSRGFSTKSIRSSRRPGTCAAYFFPSTTQSSTPLGGTGGISGIFSPAQRVLPSPRTGNSAGGL